MKSKENNTLSAIFGDKNSGTVVERFVGYVLSSCSVNKNIRMSTPDVFKPMKTLVFISAFSMLGFGLLAIMGLV